MTETVTMTASAASRIREIAAHSALRVSVNGGGCSGFQYGFEITADRQPDDVAIERDGATVLIDSTSLGILAGSEIDFVDDLIGQSFKIKNPQAKMSCGCGTSFSI